MPTREFPHVADAAEAVVLAVAIPTASHPMNIGTGVETSIRELAAMVGDAVRYQGDVRWDTSAPDGQPRRYLDVTGAREQLGFTAHVPLGAGIKEAVDWYLTNR